MPAGMSLPEALFDGGAEPLVLPVCDHYAGSEALIRKSLALQSRMGPVFDVTADCEDSAPVGGEAAYARMVAALANSTENRFGRMGVRIHDLHSRHWHSDLEALVGTAGERLAYVTLPLVDDFDEVERAANAIDDVASQNGVRRIIPLHVVIETHGGLAAVHRIAAHSRVECLSFGLIDYVAAFGGALDAAAMRSPGQFEHPLVRRAKGEMAVAAHACGKVASHNISTDIDTPQAAGLDARRAASEYGFARMWSIHPAQIAPIIGALTPDPVAIATASEILLAGSAAGWLPVRHAGHLLDRGSYRHWWGVLRRARAGGATLAVEIERAFFPH